MKKNLPLLCFLLFFMGASGIAQITFGTGTDTVGRPFRTITINKDVGLTVKYSHTWTAENLNITVDGSWCYNDVPENCGRYGRLYTWEAAHAACTKLGEGWRLPTDLDWQRLMHQFSEGGLISDERGNKAAYSALIDNGSSGFNALPGGARYSDGEYVSLGRSGLYWSATGNDAVNAWYYDFDGGDERAGRSLNLKSYALSCRCLKDGN